MTSAYLIERRDLWYPKLRMDMQQNDERIGLGPGSGHSMLQTRIRIVPDEAVINSNLPLKPWIDFWYAAQLVLWAQSTLFSWFQITLDACVLFGNGGDLSLLHVSMESSVWIEKLPLDQHWIFSFSLFNRISFHSYLPNVSLRNANSNHSVIHFP